MVINKEILYSSGARLKQYDPEETVFYEGDHSSYYYQIVEGEIKLNNYSADGKEFIQNIVGEGQSFGESLLFDDRPYPMNAVAISPCRIFRLSKSSFFNMLEESPNLYADFCKSLADQLYYKYIMLQKNSLEKPEERLKGILDYLKSLQKKQSSFSFHVPLTRQQLACLTGLRVETAIRTIKKMEKEKSLKIINRKILY